MDFDNERYQSESEFYYLGERRMLQRKSHFNVELCGSLVFFWLFYVRRGERNETTVLSFGWKELFSYKRRACRKDFLLWERVVFGNFALSFGRLCQNIAAKSVPRVQHD